MPSLQEDKAFSNVGKDSKKSTTLGAMINLFKGYIGSGILALPYSF